MGPTMIVMSTNVMSERQFSPKVRDALRLKMYESPLPPTCEHGCCSKRVCDFAGDCDSHRSGS